MPSPTARTVTEYWVAGVSPETLEPEKKYVPPPETKVEVAES